MICQPLIEPALTPSQSFAAAQRQIIFLQEQTNDPVLITDLPVPPGQPATDRNYLQTYLKQFGDKILQFNARIRHSLAQLSKQLFESSNPFRSRIAAFKRIASLKPLKLPRRVLRSKLSLPYRGVIATINTYMAEYIHATCEYLRHLADARTQFNLFQAAEVYALLCRITPFNFTFADLTSNPTPIELQDPEGPPRPRRAKPSTDASDDTPADTADSRKIDILLSDLLPTFPKLDLCPPLTPGPTSQNRHLPTFPSASFPSPSSFGNLAIL